MLLHYRQHVPEIDSRLVRVPYSRPCGTYEGRSYESIYAIGPLRRVKDHVVTRNVSRQHPRLRSRSRQAGRYPRQKDKRCPRRIWDDVCLSVVCELFLHVGVFFFFLSCTLSPLSASSIASAIHLRLHHGGGTVTRRSRSIRRETSVGDFMMDLTPPFRWVLSPLAQDETALAPSPAA
jgi:hypothetical protein